PDGGHLGQVVRPAVVFQNLAAAAVVVYLDGQPAVRRVLVLVPPEHRDSARLHLGAYEVDGDGVVGTTDDQKHVSAPGPQSKGVARPPPRRCAPRRSRRTLDPEALFGVLAVLRVSA